MFDLQADARGAPVARTWAVALLFGLLAVGLLVRVAYLQLGGASAWSSRAQEQYLQSVDEPAQRGRILDRAGRVLVDHRRVLMLSAAEGWEPSEEQFARLEKVVGSGGRRQFELTGHVRVPEDRYAMAAELTILDSALQLSESSERYYPHGELAGHLLGAVRLGEHGGIEVRGEVGLEAQYDDLLSGVAGRRELLVSATGRPLGLLNQIEPQDGDDLVLGLDWNLQRVAERALLNASNRLKGRAERRPEAPSVALLMEVPSGQILCLAQRPSYSPALFLERTAELQELLNDPSAPLLNRAVAGLYPAASTFKLVTGAAVIDELPGRAEQRFYCPGQRTIGETVFHCFVTSGHGGLDFREAIAHSCDTVFYDLAVELGPARLGEAAAKLGFGRPTGIDLPGEEGGLLPTPEWIREEVGRSWFDGDSANLGVGQGFLLVTPLQLATGVARLLCDSEVVPRLSKLKASGEKPGVVPSERYRVLWQGSAGATSYGTASGFAVPGLSVAGKTGTAEAPTTADNPEGRNHVWFVGWAPADRPEVVALAFFEGSGGYGGEVAAPVAREMLEAWQAWRDSQSR